MDSQRVLDKRDSDTSILDGLRAYGFNKKTYGAVFGLIGGILSALFGSLFTAIGWFSGPNWHGFAVQHLGTWFLFLTIPLLLFGAHCLDLADRRRNEPNGSATH